MNKKAKKRRDELGKEMREEEKKEKKKKKNFFKKIWVWLWKNPDNWEDKEEIEIVIVKTKGQLPQEKIVIGVDGKPKTKIVKEGRKHGFYRRLGWFLTIISIMIVLWIFASIFVGKILFKIILSLIVGCVIGIKPKRWLWRILTFIAVFFVNMLYIGESIELFRLAVLFTVCGATCFFLIERRTGVDAYPKWMLPFFLIISVSCILWALFGLVRSHEYYVQKQRVSVSNLLKEADTGEKLKNKFSFSKSEIKVPKSYIPILILEKEEEPTSRLSQNWLVLKVKNNLPAEYGRLNCFIRKILFVIFFLAVNLIFGPVATLEIFKDWIAEKKGEKKEKTQTDAFSLYGMIQAIQDLVSSLRKKRR